MTTQSTLSSLSVVTLIVSSATLALSAAILTQLPKEQPAVACVCDAPHAETHALNPAPVMHAPVTPPASTPGEAGASGAPAPAVATRPRPPGSMPTHEGQLMGLSRELGACVRSRPEGVQPGEPIGLRVGIELIRSEADPQAATLALTDESSGGPAIDRTCMRSIVEALTVAWPEAAPPSSRRVRTSVLVPVDAP